MLFSVPPQPPPLTTEHTQHQPQNARTLRQQPYFQFTTPPTHTPEASYNGYKKTAVFSQWQKNLQKQEYETACHWTAELDVSGWQDDLWSKIIVYASKHIHLHSPSLPSLLARNFAFYRHHVQTQGSATSTTSSLQPRNVPSLRQNLFQAIGMLSLSPKGPVYTLPKVDPQKVDESELLVDTHVWLAPHVQPYKGDDASVVRLLSTVCSQLELNNIHKAMYWLSVLVEYEKHQKKYFKKSLSMVARKPILPDGMRTKPKQTNASPLTTATNPKHSNGVLNSSSSSRSPSTSHANHQDNNHFQCAVVEGKHSQDWVWLLWYGLWEACKSFRRGVQCGKSFQSLSYLFAHDYTISKRSTRMPLVLHAMLLVRTDTADWNKSVYPNDHSAHLISTACRNVYIIYNDIATKRTARERVLGLSVGADSRQLQVGPRNNQTPNYVGSKKNRYVGVGGVHDGPCSVDPVRNANTMKGNGMIILHVDANDATTDNERKTTMKTTKTTNGGTHSGSCYGTGEVNVGSHKGTKSKTSNRRVSGEMSVSSARKMEIMNSIDADFLG